MAGDGVAYGLLGCKAVYLGQPDVSKEHAASPLSKVEEKAMQKTAEAGGKLRGRWRLYVSSKRRALPKLQDSWPSLREHQSQQMSFSPFENYLPICVDVFSDAFTA